MPMREEDPRLYAGGLRRSTESLVRAGTYPAGARCRADDVRSDRDARRAVWGDLPAASVLRLAGPGAGVETVGWQRRFQAGHRSSLTRFKARRPRDPGPCPRFRAHL